MDQPTQLSKNNQSDQKKETKEEKKEETKTEATTEELTKVKQELELWQKKAEDYLNGWKRAKADYINFKKNSEKEKEELMKFANAALIIQLLPVVNNFKRAFEQRPKIQDEKIENYFKGFEHIYREFSEFLKRLGVEEIKTVGEKFNPQFHEAVSSETTKTQPEEINQVEKEAKEQIIVKEVSAGYMIYGKVIMPAKVVIKLKINN